MTVRKTKPPKASPTFEKMNQERLKKCVETTQSAKKAVETSKKITQEARELIESIRNHRR